MKKSTVLAAFAVAAVLGTASAVWALPEVSGVTMQQRANSRWVDIVYTLSGEEAIITLGIETNGVAIPDSAVTRLVGDVSKVMQPGTYSISWNAGADWPEHSVTEARARVTAWSTNAPPQIMVVDLSGGPNADDYPVLYYTSVAALPGGVTNTAYKSSHIVMRKIVNGIFSMGEASSIKTVTLSNDFYTGVFQVTQGQWAQVMNKWPAMYTDGPSRTFRPVEQVSYHDVREYSGTNLPLDTNWPQTNAVGPDSFMGLLRAKTSLTDFDLPTEAQWEYACRAGTTTYYNDGGLGGRPNTTSNAQIDVLGRYKWNGGKINGNDNPDRNCGPENGTAIVGSYLPNEWGLYDMHGNVREWCLDWSAETLSGGVNPKGADEGTYRILRGGCWEMDASVASSAARYRFSPTVRTYGVIGFRLVRNIAQ